MKQWNRRYRGWNYRITGIVTGILVLLFLLGLYKTQVILLANAQKLGNELASRYAEEELHSVHTAQSLLELGVYFLEEQVDDGASQTELEQWVQNFCQNVTTLADGAGVRPIGIIQGIPVDAGPLEEERANDVLQATWYQQALQSDGEIVFGNTPADALTGHVTITIAQKCRNSDNVLAFDINLDDFSLSSTDDSLPVDSSYFLCDAEGELLYARTKLQATPEELEEYLHRILGQIQAGQLDDAQEYIYDLTSEKRAVYFNTAENGWVSIITIPYTALLGELRQVFNWAMAICAGLVLFLILMGIRAYRAQKRMARVNETVAALGNLYYSIYRVNASQGSYETVKGAKDIIHKIPAQGPYDRLLEVIGQLIDQETFVQFKTSFSLENSAFNGRKYFRLRRRFSPYVWG